MTRVTRLMIYTGAVTAAEEGAGPGAGEAAASLLGSGRVSPDQPTLGRLSRLIVLLRGGGGGGSGGRGGGDGLDGEAAEALRVALHLNVAAVALRREDWYLAAAACRSVTERRACLVTTLIPGSVLRMTLFVTDPPLWVRFV